MQRHRHNRLKLFALAAAAVMGIGFGGAAQATSPSVSPSSATEASGPVDPALFDSLQWRNLGPNLGGRSLAVAGSPSRPNEYYFGATGGGLWKTTDAGQSWKPVTDKYLTSSSVGAVAVCPTNPDVVYIGTGEADLRGSILPGDGVYRSTDAGATWSHIGLEDTQTVSKIRIDPADCNRVLVAALGHPFGKNTERGVFRTTDGGQSWSKTLYRDDLTGAADVVIDPNNAKVVYASLWHAYRQPWLLNSGGEGSGLFKSTDGGAHWTELTTHPGLPEAPIGKIGLAVSPQDSNLVWAVVEAKNGGLYRSDDGGDTWHLVSNDAELIQRSFYYMHVVADPKDRNTLYVLNVNFLKSTDGGKTFTEIDTPHGDNHDLWLDPDNPQRMIEGNDGGAAVSTNGGNTWTAETHPTAQFYHVTTTSGTPYQICGAQQDRSTLCVASNGNGSGYTTIGGGESGYVAVDRSDENIFYSGNYGGTLGRFDQRLGSSQSHNVNPWPDNPMGYPAKDIKERFQWTFPIMTSTADPKALYSASQHIFRSTDRGESWQQISPDLTRADPATMGDSGGPITKDQTSVEYYATVFSVAPSPLDKKLIWAGSDDGLVHVTRDLGKKWADVTPAGIPHFIRFSMIDAGHHDTDTAYAAGQRYQLDDNTPYLFKTHDGGKHWTAITTGIAPGDFAWTIREDPERPGLLYAGTQHGVYVSFDDGAHWQSLRLGLPDTSVQDITTHGDDLIIATHGRGFYTMSGLSVLRQLTPSTTKQQAEQLMRAIPQHAGTAVDGGSAHETPSGAATSRSGTAGTGAAATPNSELNKARKSTAPAASALSGGTATLYQPADPTRSVDSGATVHFTLDQPASKVDMTFLDTDGHEIRTFTGLPTSAGSYAFTWDLRYPGPTTFPGIVWWSASTTRGPKAPLGDYTVRLSVDGTPITQNFTVNKDPRLTKVTAKDIQREFDLAMAVRDRTSNADQAVIDIGQCTKQIGDRITAADDPQITADGQALTDKLSGISDEIHQSKSKASEDPLNYPIKLNNKIAALLGVIESADHLPTAQTNQVFDLLSGQLDTQLTALHTTVGTDVGSFNTELDRLGLQPVSCQG
jgi:photosystem II stability/assembly factor-like uncharacterized protein